MPWVATQEIEVRMLIYSFDAEIEIYPALIRGEWNVMQCPSKKIDLSNQNIKCEFNIAIPLSLKSQYFPTGICI